MKIVLAEKVSNATLAVFAGEEGWKVVSHDQIKNGLAAELANADALVVRSAVQVDEALLEAAHHGDRPLDKARDFLEEGNKARITVMFRGREITHREIGQAILTRIGQELKEIAVIEQAPRLEGRLLFMILAPNPRWLQSNRARAEAAERAQASQPAAPPPPPPPAAAVETSPKA